MAFSKIAKNWGASTIEFVPVACNVVVFSSIATYLDLVIFSSKYILRALQSCGIFKPCHIFGGFNNLHVSPLLAIFQELQNIWWLQKKGGDIQHLDDEQGCPHAWLAFTQTTQC